MDNLYAKLFDCGCVKFGEFKLKSGIISPVYVDFRTLVSYPETLAEVGKAMADVLKGLSYDRIAGIPYAGLPLGVAVSLANGKPMIYPRKEQKSYGTAKLIEGEYKPGETVVIIDDIITDGASKIETIAPLQEAGLVVKDVVIVLDREQGGAAKLQNAGYTLHSVGTLSQVLESLVRQGKVSPEKRDEVAQFIADNQFK
ncbi:MAG: orotate phosphoribosyltransferase [Armatimonadota bacterium]|nr:orotate phosphoribosyltransferase [Armatimonadota bacterium]